MTIEAQAQVDDQNTAAESSEEDDDVGYDPHGHEVTNNPSKADFFEGEEEEADEEVEGEETAKPAETTAEAKGDSGDPWESLDRDAKADLLDTARRMGMSDAEARQWTPQGLKSRLTQRINQALAQQQQQRAPEPVQKANEPFKPNWQTLEQELNPELLNTLKGTYESQQQTIGTLQQQLQQQSQQYQQYVAQQQQASFDALTERFESRVDAVIAKQPELEKLLGKGSIYDLREGSTEFENRRRLFDELQRQNIPSNGTTAPPLGEGRAFEKALNATFGSELREFEKQKLAKELQKNSNRATARPTARGTSTKNGLQRAIELSRGIDRKLGD